MKALDRILLARADEQVGGDKDWKEKRGPRGPRRMMSCTAPGCSGHFSPQSKLRMCPTHSEIVYRERAKANSARYQATRKAKT